MKGIRKMKVKQRQIRDIVNIIDNLILNYKCPCIGTEHCPCARCEVSIGEAKMLKVLRLSGRAPVAMNRVRYLVPSLLGLWDLAS